ncbi:hypothetical protein ACFVUH_35080 [Kitasatospora sp. NPDC058032]|uniref:hypothetical protein n=1 Tax=Kitasatospora sp. NPDC058032 TaxID=3346307 RepID=UPI0036DD1439
MHRRRTAATLAGAAVLAALTATTAPAAAATMPAAPSATAKTTCGNWAIDILWITACIDVDGTQVNLWGKAYPPSLNWSPQSVPFKFSATAVGQPPITPVDMEAVVPMGGIPVQGMTFNVPCGTQVTGTFGIPAGPWPPSSSSVTVTVPC